jgi:hypothetical protein
VPPGSAWRHPCHRPTLIGLSDTPSCAARTTVIRGRAFVMRWQPHNHAASKRPRASARGGSSRPPPQRARHFNVQRGLGGLDGGGLAGFPLGRVWAFSTGSIEYASIWIDTEPNKLVRQSRYQKRMRTQLSYLYIGSIMGCAGSSLACPTIGSCSWRSCTVRLRRQSACCEIDERCVWELFSLCSEENFPPFLVIDFAYNHIPEHTRFRELMVAWYTWHDGTSLSDRMSTTEQLEGQPRFAAELTRSLMQRLSAGGRDPLLDNPDTYYEKAI